RGEGAGSREHGRVLRPGTRGADRSARALRPRAQARGLRGSDADLRDGRRDRRKGRHGVSAHRFRHGAGRDEGRSRPAFPAQRLRRSRRPRPAAAAVDQRFGARHPGSRQLRRRGAARARTGRRARPRRHAAPRTLPVQARRPSGRAVVPDRAGGVPASAQPQPIPPHRAAPAAAGRGRLAGNARGDGVSGAGNRPKAPAMLSAEAILAWTTERLAKGADSEALAALAEAAVRFPANAGIAVRHADALHLAGQLAPAAAAYRRALLLDPAAVDGWNGLGCAELARGALGETVRCLRQALALQPGRLDIRFNLAKALFDLGEVDAAVDGYRAVAEAGPSALARDALAAIACIIPGASSADNAAVLRARRDWAREEAKTLGLAGRGCPAPAATGGKLRVGYVSAFFGERNWMKPVWAAVNHHDRARFEIHFFHDVKPPSAESGYRDHADDVVHDVRKATNEGLAGYVARCGIDILVDLN